VILGAVVVISGGGLLQVVTLHGVGSANSPARFAGDTCDRSSSQGARASCFRSRMGYGTAGIKTIRATGDYSDQVSEFLRGQYDFALLTYEKLTYLALEFPFARHDFSCRCRRGANAGAVAIAYLLGGFAGLVSPHDVDDIFGGQKALGTRGETLEGGRGGSSWIFFRRSANFLQR
jgi:hypothetical protein